MNVSFKYDRYADFRRKVTSHGLVPSYIWQSLGDMVISGAINLDFLKEYNDQLKQIADTNRTEVLKKARITGKEAHKLHKQRT